MKKLVYIISIMGFLVVAASFFSASLQAEEIPGGGTESGITVPGGEQSGEITSPGGIAEGTASEAAFGFRIHFLNVDHGMATIVQCDGETMIVDAGPLVKYHQETESWTDIPLGERAKDFLVSRGVDKIEYMIASHPHADHINGLVSVIDTFQVDSLMMPQVDYETQFKKKHYKKFLTAVEEHQIPVTTPSPGSIFMLGSAKVTVFAPNSLVYDDLNNTSIVLRIDHGENSFLLAGDCLKESEQEMMAAGYDLKVDVLTAPHHGIAGVHTYSDDHFAFIEAVGAPYAIISNNILASYAFLTRLRQTADVYCTYSSGTIGMGSDGTNLSIWMDYGTEPDYYALDQLTVTCKDETFSYVDPSQSPAGIEKFYKKGITLNFSGHYGQHQYTNIEYMMVRDGEEYNVNGVWTQGNQLKIKENFRGYVYVRYTNEKGNYVYAKTQGFVVDKTGITNPSIVTKDSGIRAIRLKKVNKKPYILKKKTAVSMSAISSPAGIVDISYQLVKMGEAFDKEGEWISGDSAVLKRGFDGNLYVRYTDACGRKIYKKTRWVQVPKKKKVVPVG